MDSLYFTPHPDELNPVEAPESCTAFASRWRTQLRGFQSGLASSAAPFFASSMMPAQVLSRELTDYAGVLPAHTRKRCEDDLKAFTARLAAAVALAHPKPKFSFKDRGAAPALPFSKGPASSQDAAPLPSSVEPPPVPASVLTLTSTTSPRYLSFEDLPTSADGSDALVLRGMEGCFVDLAQDATQQTGEVVPESEGEAAGEEGGAAQGRAASSAVYLYDLVRTVVLLPPLHTGSIMVHGCRDCLFLLGSHQFRMHVSERCRICLQVGSTPIIEGCRELLFGAYPSTLSSTTLPPSSFAAVKDFDTPFASPTNPSPNWRCMTSADEYGIDFDFIGWRTRGARRDMWSGIVAGLGAGGEYEDVGSLGAGKTEA